MLQIDGAKRILAFSMFSDRYKKSNPIQPDPTVPPSPNFEMGPPQTGWTMIRSNDLKFWKLLSKVGQLGSVDAVSIAEHAKMQRRLPWLHSFLIFKPPSPATVSSPRNSELRSL